MKCPGGGLTIGCCSLWSWLGVSDVGHRQREFVEIAGVAQVPGDLEARVSSVI